MKKIIFSAILLCSLSMAGFSQDRPQRDKKTPEQKAQIMTDRLATKLSLTDNQKAEVYKINLDKAREMEKFHSKAKEERQKAFEEQKKQLKDSEDKINKILTEDQKKAYADLKTQRQEKIKKHRGDFKRGPKDSKTDN